MLDRTRRLFYVCCSRAVKDLAVVLFAADVASRNFPTKTGTEIGLASSKLRLQWSPEQIAGWLKHMYAVNKDYQVSHETCAVLGSCIDRVNTH